MTTKRVRKPGGKIPPNRSPAKPDPAPQLAAVAVWVQWAIAALYEIQHTADRLHAAANDPAHPLYGLLDMRDSLSVIDDGVSRLHDLSIPGLLAPCHFPSPLPV